MIRSMLLAASLLIACGPTTNVNVNEEETEETENDEMSISPWHMWGGLAKVHASTLSPGLLYTTSGQLARVEYKRPESWRFLFFARVFAAHQSSPSILQVDFTIIPGVGRGSVNVQPFERYKITLPIGDLPAPIEKWSTSVNGPIRDDTAPVPPTTPTPNVTDSFTAQDAQVSFTASVQLTVPGDTVDAEVGCLLAPWHHARPDWVMRHFGGEEINGR